MSQTPPNPPTNNELEELEAYVETLKNYREIIKNLSEIIEIQRKQIASLL